MNRSSSPALWILGSLLLVGIFSDAANAYSVVPESFDNQIRIQIDDRIEPSKTYEITAEIVSAPEWVLPAPPETVTGHITEILTRFDVTSAALGSEGTLTLRITARSSTGSLEMDRLHSVPLVVVGVVEPIQRAFRIEECCLATSSIEDPTRTPSGPTLVGVTPNPVRSLAHVLFGLPEGGGAIRLQIFDVAGRSIQEIETGSLPAGYHKITWDGTDRSGRAVSPGVYFYSLSSGDWSETQKLQLLR